MANPMNIIVKIIGKIIFEEIDLALYAPLMILTNERIPKIAKRPTIKNLTVGDKSKAINDLI